MKQIHVSHQFNAPIEVVFSALSDHENFLSGSGLKCKLVQNGRPERDGLGAMREVRTGGMLLTEEITEFERPHAFSYVIRSATRNGRALPLQHERGWLELAEASGGTRVDWTSRIAIPVPVIGGLLEWLFVRRASAAFAKLLQRAQRRLQGHSD